MLTNENNLAVIKAVKGNSPACLWLAVIYQQQICLIMTQILYALLGKAQYMPISKRSLSAGFRQSETNLGTGRIGTRYHTSGGCIDKTCPLTSRHTMDTTKGPTARGISFSVESLISKPERQNAADETGKSKSPATTSPPTNFSVERLLHRQEDHVEQDSSTRNSQRHSEDGGDAAKTSRKWQDDFYWVRAPTSDSPQRKYGPGDLSERQLCVPSRYEEMICLRRYYVPPIGLVLACA